MNITLQYDPVGNPSAIFPWEGPGTGSDGGDTDGGSTSPPPSSPPLQQFVYDDLDRLAEVQAGDGGLQRRWTYDPTNNRLSEEVPGTSGGTGDSGDQDEPTDPSGGTSGGITPYTYASDSHWLLDVGGTARAYDAAGNTTQIDNQTLIYNAVGRLAKVREGALTIATYAYNGRGERVRKATGGLAKTFVYNERGQLLGEYGAMGFVEYLWLDDLLVGVSTINGLYRIETDQLGTPRVAIGEYGNIAWRWTMNDNAFGQQSPDVIGDGDSPGLELNLRFPGQYFDQETGLHYTYFRDYDPRVGRYVESDPIGLRGGLNIYSYSYQSPLKYIDPDGLFATRLWLRGFCLIADHADEVINHRKRNRRSGCRTIFVADMAAIDSSCELHRENCRAGSKFALGQRGSFDQDCLDQCLNSGAERCQLRRERAQRELEICLDRIGSDVNISCTFTRRFP
ncbi:MAG: RHS repeat-associated core domain-containing protein [Wenzhouxiangellaceae bacterium]